MLQRPAQPATSQHVSLHRDAPARAKKRRRSVRAHHGQKQAEISTADWQHLPVKHVIESQQFSQQSLDLIFEVTRDMERVRPGTEAARQLDGYVMSTLFYEPSTRTRLSFEGAMSRLGGGVVSTENAREFSSVAKGETLEGKHLTTPLRGPVLQMQCQSRPQGQILTDAYSVFQAVCCHKWVQSCLQSCRQGKKMSSWPCTATQHPIHTD